MENPVPTIAKEPIKTERFHIVRTGDTLSRISYRYYGTANKWQKIFERNRNTISDANKLAIGIKLIIPD
jgi:nucleoid-associated protein YgaU